MLIEIAIILQSCGNSFEDLQEFLISSFGVAVLLHVCIFLFINVYFYIVIVALGRGQLGAENT